MKRLLLFSLLGVSALCGYSEDILQIVPQRIEKGSTSDDARTFEIELVNQAEFCALEFDLYLPEGMEFDDIDPIEMCLDRFPHTTGRGGVVKFDHTVDFSKRPGGFYRVQVGFTGADKVNSKIAGNSGVLFTVYYVTSDNLPDGILPVKIDNVTFAISGTQGIYPPASASYFYAGDYDPSTASTLNLSGLTGYMSAGVVEETNALISANDALTEIRLDNLDEAGAKIAPANPNCLVYLAEDSDALAQGVASGNAVSVGASGVKASSVSLTDGMDFDCGSSIACESIGYDRIFDITDWQALYLPFDISYNDWAPYGSVALLKGVRSASDADVLVWEIAADGTIPANTPCIFKPSNSGALHLEVSASDIVEDSGANYLSFSSASGNTYTLSGTYVTKTDMASSDSYGLYEGHFHPASSDAATLSSFRVYLNIDGANNRIARVCNIFQDGTSIIDAIDMDASSDAQLYDINGRPARPAIPGLYISRNNKMIIK